MALHYQNVYLGTDQDGQALKVKIKSVAFAQGFHSTSEFCRWAICEKVADLEKKGRPHEQSASPSKR